MDPLKIGVAYHSSRTLKTVRLDLEDICAKGFNTVIHMFSHNDWKRCPSVMKDIISYSNELGLDVWVDNWGLMGAPGDPCHFPSYHPEAIRMFSDGTLNAPKVCLNSDAFVEWTKEWIDLVYDCGGRKIFWDEPALAMQEDKFACGCPHCRELFRERYGREMPVIPDADCADFQVWTITNYFKKVTEYATEKGMENSVCVMLSSGLGISLDNIDEMAKIETMQNIGSDPYWNRKKHPEWTSEDVYEYVYKNAKKNMDVCEKTGKGHNLWVKAYGLPKWTERDTVYAAEAIYDAGARNIFFWGYRGCDGNEYRSECTELQWSATAAAAQRLWDKEREIVVANARKKLGLDK